KWIKWTAITTFAIVAGFAINKQMRSNDNALVEGGLRPSWIARLKNWRGLWGLLKSKPALPILPPVTQLGAPSISLAKDEVIIQRLSILYKALEKLKPINIKAGAKNILYNAWQKVKDPRFLKKLAVILGGGTLLNAGKAYYDYPNPLLQDPLQELTKYQLEILVNIDHDLEVFLKKIDTLLGKDLLNLALLLQVPPQDDNSRDVIISLSKKITTQLIVVNLIKDEKQTAIIKDLLRTFDKEKNLLKTIYKLQKKLTSLTNQLTHINNTDLKENAEMHELFEKANDKIQEAKQQFDWINKVAKSIEELLKSKPQNEEPAIPSLTGFDDDDEDVESVEDPNLNSEEIMWPLYRSVVPTIPQDTQKNMPENTEEKK
ncbi:MAG: hypothetical protein HY072_05235, partial [Deltaproteobacteria bacterium]|nr:hypothetical protein [Deltaproteobacteria bacterium]